jgi:hypothetical protein
VMITRETRRRRLRLRAAAGEGDHFQCCHMRYGDHGQCGICHRKRLQVPRSFFGRLSRKPMIIANGGAGPQRGLQFGQ